VGPVRIAHELGRTGVVPVPSRMSATGSWSGAASSSPDRASVRRTAGQKFALGRIQAGHVVTVHVAAETITIDLAGEDTRTLRRTTAQPVRCIKAHQPRQRLSGTQDEAASGRTGGPPPAMLEICQETCPARLATRGSRSAWNSGS
jgi:hypothetical protein